MKLDPRVPCMELNHKFILLMLDAKVEMRGHGYEKFALHYFAGDCLGAYCFLPASSFTQDPQASVGKERQLQSNILVGQTWDFSYSFPVRPYGVSPSKAVSDLCSMTIKSKDTNTI
jgi:hypothetical protein